MKATNNAKKAVESYLQELASKDPLLAETLKKPNKNIDGCMSYIMSQAQKKKANMMTDEEVFQLAVHYYDEDSIKDEPAKGVKLSHSNDGEAEVKNVAPKPAPVSKPKKKEVVLNQVQASLF